MNPTLWERLKLEPEKGQSMIEFALVLIFIILPVTFILIETSMILYKYVALTNAAREGARAGSVYLYVGNPGGFAAPDAGRSTLVTSAVQGTIGPVIDRPPDCNNSGIKTSCVITYGPSGAPIIDYLRSTDLMTVSLVHTHSFLFGALGSEINLETRSRMRIEPSTVISGTGP